MKRAFDLSLAVLLALPALLLVLPAALLVWAEARCSPFFRQQRVGLARRPFIIMKLRTMHSTAPQGGSHEVGSIHILRSAVWLRRLKIDELPQIWNVLTGDMSFVGPRPCLPSQTELIDEREARGVYALVPGITGPAQVRGIDMSTPRRLAEIDATYLSRWSLGRDISLLARTATGSGRMDAAAATPPVRRERKDR